jgi:multidrug resistance protein
MKRAPAIPFILITLLLDVMGFGLLLPVLPALVGEFTASRDAQTYWYGAMIVTFGLTQFFCSPLLGALSDRFGRRPVLLGSIFGLGMMFLLSALATSLTGLLLARIFGGVLAANFAVANAYVADITTPENRAKSFGMIGAAFGIGYIIGPMVGGLLGSIDIRLPFYVAAGLSMLNFIYGYFVVPESLPPSRRKAIPWKRANPIASLYGLVRLKSVGVLVAVIAVANLAQFILHGTWVLYTDFRFGWGPRETGLSLFAVGMMAAIVQGGLLGWLLKKMGRAARGARRPRLGRDHLCRLRPDDGGLDDVRDHPRQPARLRGGAGAARDRLQGGRSERAGGGDGLAHLAQLADGGDRAVPRHAAAGRGQPSARRRLAHRRAIFHVGAAGGGGAGAGRMALLAAACTRRGAGGVGRALASPEVD